ncbi:MAG: aspartate kinase [Rickettsiaceae bacterium]|nr:aspartate kinase [Rickettsiaceae bacterium]
MPLLVLKFGGTSLGNIERIKHVASLIHQIKQQGNTLAIVVSAMAGSTNNILSLCTDLVKTKTLEKAAEIDNALSTGETLSASLLSIALMESGLKSIALGAWQIGIFSDNSYNNAKIVKFEANIIKEYINKDIIPIITGFQAISNEGRISTIGRGGSDTTASFVAAALNADSCDIYTDVEGIYTLDPRLSDKAAIIPCISFEEVLELAGSGAKVLHPRCVEICMRYQIPLRIFSSFTNKSGTIIMNQVNETKKITGISYQKNLVFIRVPDIYNIIELFSNLNSRNITIIYFEINDSYGLKLVISEEQVDGVISILNIMNLCYTQDIDVSSITVVGACIRNDLNIVTKILKILKNGNKNILSTSNSEIKFTIFCKEEDSLGLIKQLHHELIEYKHENKI